MEKMGQIACFGPLFFLEWCGNEMVFCKDLVKDLSFWVDEFLS